MKVLFKVLIPGARIPARAYDSAGWDLYPVDRGVIQPGEQVSIRLGFATAFDRDWVAVIDDRGSVGRAGVSHMAGVIDADFRGEWMLMMRNHSQVPFAYGPEKALAQALFLQAPVCDAESVDQLPESARGSGMLGSSDNWWGLPPEDVAMMAKAWPNCLQRIRGLLSKVANTAPVSEWFKRRHAAHPAPDLLLSSGQLDYLEAMVMREDYKPNEGSL